MHTRQMLLCSVVCTLALLFSGSSALANTCATCEPLTCGAETIAGNTLLEGNDVDLLGSFCTGYPTTGEDHVYCVDIPQNGTFTATMTATYDGSLYLITDCADPDGTCLAGADVFPPGLPKDLSYTNFSVQGCLNAFLVVDGYGGAAGPYALDFQFSDCCTGVVPTGACCFRDGTCSEETGDDCINTLGGEYQGDGTTCNPNLCPQPPTGSCCLEDGSCVVDTEDNCIAANGAYRGDDTDCVQPCTVAVEQKTWGQVRTLYQ